METAKINYQSGKKTSATHILSGKTIETDAPVDNNGLGSAFSPTDLLSTSLASCMITIMAIKAEQNGFDFGKIDSVVEKTMGINPRRVIRIKVILNFEKSFSAEITDLLEKAARNCPVAQSIHPEIEQEIIFNYKQA